jgi:hypothetical protein
VKVFPVHTLSMCATGGIASTSSTFADIQTQAMAARCNLLVSIFMFMLRRNLSKRLMEASKVEEVKEYTVQIEAWKLTSGRRACMVSGEGSDIDGVSEIMWAWISLAYSVFGFGL